MIFLCLLGNCAAALGQKESSGIENDIFYYITVKCDKSKNNRQFLSGVLLINNQSNETICIESFNKYIFHKLEYSKKERTFNWDLKINSREQRAAVFISEKPKLHAIDLSSSSKSRS